MIILAKHTICVTVVTLTHLSPPRSHSTTHPHPTTAASSYFTEPFAFLCSASDCGLCACRKEKFDNFNLGHVSLIYKTPEVLLASSSTTSAADVYRCFRETHYKHLVVVKAAKLDYCSIWIMQLLTIVKLKTVCSEKSVLLFCAFSAAMAVVVIAACSDLISASMTAL